jgi:hypothetical protein
LNETLHHSPRRFSKRIIASMGFSHSLDPERTISMGSGPPPIKFTPVSFRTGCRH